MNLTGRRNLVDLMLLRLLHTLHILSSLLHISLPDLSVDGFLVAL